MGLISFGYAQIIYSLVLIVGYYGYFALFNSASGLSSFQQLFPSWSSNKAVQSTSSLKNAEGSSSRSLVGTFLWQSFQKLVLQEGEKLVLRSIASLVNQGIFGVVNQLGP
jgi:oligosaccharide translocation protein RFT1